MHTYICIYVYPYMTSLSFLSLYRECITCFSWTRTRLIRWNPNWVQTDYNENWSCYCGAAQIPACSRKIELYGERTVRGERSARGRIARNPPGKQLGATNFQFNRSSEWPGPWANSRSCLFPRSADCGVITGALELVNCLFLEESRPRKIAPAPGRIVQIIIRRCYRVTVATRNASAFRLWPGR